MPQPMHLPPEPGGPPQTSNGRPPRPSPGTPTAVGRHEAGEPRHQAPLPAAPGDPGVRPAQAPAPRPRPVDEDSTGHALAMRLPEWDLLPPTEFLDRPRGR
jgi:hypothetical protein